MTAPKWLEPTALVLLHGEILAEFGGPSGLRDGAALESALARPINRHAYEPDADYAVLAASYAFGIARNHPFVDGNKRAAFLAMGLFLAINGHRLTAGQPEAFATISALAAGEIDEAALADWVRANSRLRSGT